MKDVCGGLAQRSDLFVAVLHETDAPKLRAKGLYYLKPEELRQIDGFLNQAGPILQGDWSPLSLGSMAHWMGAAMTGGSEPQRRQILAAMQTELPRVMKGLQAGAGAARLVRVALAEHLVQQSAGGRIRRPTA